MRFRQTDGAKAGLLRCPTADYGRHPAGQAVWGSPVLNEAQAIALRLKDTPTDTGIVNGPDFVAAPIETGLISTDAVEAVVVSQPLAQSTLSTDALEAFVTAQPAQLAEVY